MAGSPSTNAGHWLSRKVDMLGPKNSNDLKVSKKKKKLCLQSLENQQNILLTVVFAH